jgi:hypothetical protein
MSAAELKLTYAPDDEWLGEVTAIVRSGAYSGKGTAWFDRGSLKDKFIARLRSFPLTSEMPPTFEGGFGRKGEHGGVDQCHLRVAIKPYNSRGTLLVHVDLASEAWKTPDADQQNSATIRFLTEYAAVGTFADDFEKVLDGAKEQAVLRGLMN